MTQTEGLLNVTGFSNAIYATVAGLFVGALIKWVNKVTDRKKDQLAEHVILRKELREELDSVKEELYKLQEELDEWKEKYYHQVELTNSLKLDILQLTEELNEYKRISGLHPTDHSGDNGWTKRDELL